MSGPAAGNTSAGYSKYQVVDLARIARHPDHPGIMRVMLRLWRDYLAGRWDYWDTPVHAAVSYALPGKEGNLLLTATQNKRQIVTRSEHDERQAGTRRDLTRGGDP